MRNVSFAIRLDERALYINHLHHNMGRSSSHERPLIFNDQTEFQGCVPDIWSVSLPNVRIDV